MAASLLKIFSQDLRPVIRRSYQIWPRFFSESTTNRDGELSKPHAISPSEEAIGKFGKLVETVEFQSQQTTESTSADVNRSAGNQSFASMLRKSRSIALGEDQDKRVIGKIIEVMEDDLYIDFGGKFHCVCPRPKKDGELYQRGTQVIVSLKSQEMSSAFLGSEVHITLLEADAVLLGLRFKPKVQRS